jgi:alpha-tubulin suppressor-like RCC1 family protein
VIVLWASLSAVAQPTITQPPANQTVALGGTLTLGVTAGGTTPAYQWFKDSRLIVGATNSTLTVLNAGLTNSGTYNVVVTNMNGMLISLPASVAVGNPSLLAWGSNDRGQLGNGTTTDNYTPISVASNVVAGAAGGHHSLFVDTNGTLWAMGNNSYGQFGNGTTISTNLPVSVASNVVAVAAGYYHSLFVKTDGTLWAMGYNFFGQLGNGTKVTSTNWPVNVASNVVAVTAGYYHSLFVKTDGTLWAMGWNVYGQLGTSTTSGSTNLPVSVASNVVAVTAGYYHSLFVKMDGTLWAMGDNNYGQLGNGTTVYGTNWPVCVAGNVVAVAAGAYHSLFADTNGTLWAMGWNQYGQFGNGTTSNTNLPVCAPVNVVAVAAGASYSLFTKSDGTIWTMGYNHNGQLGDGTNNSVPNPTPINLPQLSVANIFQADTANHSLVIGLMKSLATVTLSNLFQRYSGSAINVTASTTPPGLTVNLTYNGSPNAPTDAGSYTVIGVITDPNYYGIATNTLVVGLPPQSFTAGSVNGQQLTLQLTGTPNYPYILVSATNLTPPVVWQPIFTNYADTNGNWSFTIPDLSGFPAGFYRAGAQ